MSATMRSTLAPGRWQPMTRRLFATAVPKLSPRPASATSPAATACCCCFRRPLMTRRMGRQAASFSSSAARFKSSQPAEYESGPQPADNPNFTSILDNPPQLVRSGNRHGPGLIILALIPITAFALGTWQVFRLRWKTDLLAKCEDRLVRPPLPLGHDNVLDAAEVSTTGNAGDFDYRRIEAVGTFRHDQEMLLGPRVYDGNAGYMVITPLELAPQPGVPVDPAAPPATILVNRGWIARERRSQAQRARVPGGLPTGIVRVEGMLRAPWKPNTFTPDNRPDKGEFYFPDVAGMAKLTGSLPVWVEATMEPDLLEVYDMSAKGVPIGKPAEVTLRNNHAQYIFTWYGLSLATSIMLWMVVKKPPTDVTRRVRMNKNW